MATNYPGSLDSGTQQPSPSASTEMDDSGFEHDVVHTNHSGAIIALETKVGTGSSTAVADSVLAGTGSGTSGWTTGPALASLTTTGSVGIGTASPNNLLSFGTPANGSRQIGLYENGTAHYGFGTDVNRLAIYASNSAGTAERVTVASDGKVGIGETAPENVLHVKQSGFSPSTNDDASIQVEGNWGGGVTFAENANRTMIYSPSGDKFAIRVGATASGGGTEAFYIKNDGKVGIGTNAPDTNLEVVGSVRTSTSFLVGGSGDDGIGPVTGQFGNVQTVGSGVGNYEGYSISGRAVFMHDGGTATGIYNDVNNHWILYSTHNGNTDLRHAGTWRIQANSAGASINGILTATSYVRGAGASAGSPAYSFSSDTNTGMYRVSSDHLGFSTGGALRATVASDGIHLASGDWFRSYGSAGWYSQSYAGGWYMIDTTWIRSYGSKHIYSGSGLIRTDSTSAFQMPNATGTGSYNTVRYRTSDGQLMPYTSTADSKANITEMKGLLEYLNERSLLYSLRPVIYTEADDRVDRDGLPVKTTRDEFTHGMVAEDVLEVAPELAYFDRDGELMSYAPDLFVPDIIAELQRLMPMVEELYSSANADWVAPVPRTVESTVTEREKYEAAATAQALIGFDNISDPIPNRAELDSLEAE